MKKKIFLLFFIIVMMLTITVNADTLKLKISTVSQIDSEKLAIAEQIAQLEKDIRAAIDASGFPFSLSTFS